MARNYVDYRRLEDLSLGDTHVSLSDKIHKLGEESGEVSKAYLQMAGAPNVSTSANSENVVLGVLEECCDVINVAMDIINNLELGDNVVEEMFSKKLDKWETKQLAYKRKVENE